MHWKSLLLSSLSLSLALFAGCGESDWEADGEQTSTGSNDETPEWSEAAWHAFKSYSENKLKQLEAELGKLEQWATQQGKDAQRVFADLEPGLDDRLEEARRQLFELTDEPGERAEAEADSVRRALQALSRSLHNARSEIASS